MEDRPLTGVPAREYVGVWMRSAENRSGLDAARLRADALAGTRSARARLRLATARACKPRSRSVSAGCAVRPAARSVRHTRRVARPRSPKRALPRLAGAQPSLPPSPTPSVPSARRSA